MNYDKNLSTKKFHIIFIGTLMPKCNKCIDYLSKYDVWIGVIGQYLIAIKIQIFLNLLP